MKSISEAALNFQGVPFRHRGRTVRGLDCVGLVKVSYDMCGVSLPDFRLYRPEPHEGQLIVHIKKALGEPFFEGCVYERLLAVDDVIVLRDYVEPFHVAIVAPYPFKGALGMVHACGHNGKVIYHRLSSDIIRHITHVFRKPI